MTQIAPSQAEVISFLRQYIARADDYAEIETHISHIFLKDDVAFKLKKALCFDFLDFSTLAARQHYCQREFTLNQRTAPALYLDVLPITRNPVTNGLCIGGQGPAMDWIIKMRRFDQQNLLSHMAESRSLDLTLICTLADHIISFHNSAEAKPDFGNPEYYASVINSIGDNLRAAPDILHENDISALVRRLKSLLSQHQDLIRHRADHGLVRQCHGDLHLANIVLYNGQPVPFDCIEFSEDIANIDVLYDLAFTLMDLLHYDLRPHANLLLNRYMEARRDYQGLALLPFFMALRAGIRAMVTAIAAGEAATASQKQDIRHYHALALHLCTLPTAQMVAIGGLSASGKSTVAQQIALDLMPGSGAIILRSDGIRKRLFNQRPETTLPPDAYNRNVSRKVYAIINDELDAYQKAPDGQEPVA